MATALGVGTGASASRAGDAITCPVKTEGRHTVVAVSDAQTIRLDDQSEVRLIGALPPQRPAAAPPAEPWPPETAAFETLRGLLLGKTVELARSGSGQDRYGRTLAQAFVVDENGARIWVQGALFEAGHARAYTLPGHVSCLKEALEAEQRARSGRRGLWAVAMYEPRAAAGTRELLSRLGQFATVEGTVRRTGKTSERLYLNFGDDWRWDFTASLGTKALKATPETLTALEGLAGKRVRVRGWLVRRNGPMIELDDASLIEQIGASDPG